MTDPTPPPPDRLEHVVTLVRAIDRIAEWTARIFSWLVIVLMGAMVYEVVARYVFGRPTLWAYDVSWMTYGAMFMLATAYTFYRQGHIRTDFFYNRWSPRVQGLVDGLLHIFIFFPAMILFLQAQWQSAARSWALGERSYQSPWQPPVYPLKIIIAIAVVLVLVQGVSEVLKCVYAVAKRRWP
jgi:TRAP-type mannitol/chloroaromatic compound transport system permease small subunit